MSVMCREFNKKDFLTLGTIADDERKINHLNVATTMLHTSGSIERCILAFDEDVLVGYIYGFLLPNQTLLPEFLYVIPAYRKKGIAKMLLTKLENDSNCTASMIFYHKSLHNFYEGLGYTAGENLEVAMKEIPAKRGDNT